MRIEWSVELLLLSLIIGCLGTYVTLSFCESFRLTRTGVIRSSSNSCSLVDYHHLGASIALGGVSLWAQQFIFLTAISIHESNGNNINVRFRSDMFAFSLLVVIILSLLGIWIGSGDPFYGKRRQDISTMVMEDAKNSLSMERIMRISSLDMIYIICAKYLQRVLIGALFFFLSICTVASMGILAMQYEGNTALSVETAAVLVPVLLLLLLTASMQSWLTFRLLSVFPLMESLRIMSAFIITVVKFGAQMLFIAMIRFESADRSSNTAEEAGFNTIGREQLLLWVTAVSVIIMMILLTLVIAELRTGLLKVSDEFVRSFEVLKGIKQQLYSVDGRPGCSGSSYRNSIATDSGVVGGAVQKYLSQFAVRSEMEGIMVFLNQHDQVQQPRQHELVSHATVVEVSTGAAGSTAADLESQFFTPDQAGDERSGDVPPSPDLMAAVAVSVKTAPAAAPNGGSAKRKIIPLLE